MPKTTSKLKRLRAHSPEIPSLAVHRGAQVSAPEPAPKGGIKKTESGKVEVTATHSLGDLLANLCALTGTSRNEVAIRIAGQVVDAIQVSKNTDADSIFIQAISMIAELAPQNATESMLAAQMIATHEKALFFLQAATGANQTIDGQQAAMLFATRLMRLHLDQIEAMQKLKGKAGQQKVVVEHVHVHVNEGGQAIVGAVGSEREGGGGQ